MDQYNSAARSFQSTWHIAFRMRKMDPIKLHIRAYAGASFSRNYDHTSQLGCIVLFCDKNGNAYVLHFASYKSRKVARSALGPETYAVGDSYGFAYCGKVDVERILERRVLLAMFTDSNSLFDVIIQCSRTHGSRLMIDLEYVRYAYATYEISNACFLRGQPMD